MIRGLARHHGDTASLTLEDLRRDALGAEPWLSVLVAQAERGLAGYAALCPLAQLQFGVRGMDLHHIFVRDDMRGQGVARALVEAGMDLARSRGARFMAIGTHPDNHGAHATYRAMGFDEVPAPGPRFRKKW